MAHFKYFWLIILILLPAGIWSKPTTSVSVSEAEYELYELIMEYRAQKGLPPIPLSASLTYVAQVHVRDLDAYPPQAPCNMHSWSEHGDWTPCCYTPDHAQAEGMWSKPSELTTYKGVGYEIAHWSSAGATPLGSLNGWKNSPGHNNVIINGDTWWDNVWKAIGVGIYKGYAVVWFGEETDPVSQTPQRVSELIVPPASQNSSVVDNRSSERENAQSTGKSNQQEKQDSQARYKEKKTASSQQGQLLPRYFEGSGRSYLSYVSAGYTYSFMDHRHLVSASLFDFRVTLLGMSLLSTELSVSPLDTRVAYKPSIKIYVPVTKCLAVVPYAGASVDVSCVGKYLKKNYDYNYSRDFYVGAIGGVALSYSAPNFFAADLKLEYRHPVVEPTSGAFNPKGVYLSAQLYIGKTFRRK